MFKKVFYGLFIASFVGCSAGKNKTNVELVTAMMDQESFKAQDWDPKSKDLSSMKMPPENTVPIGFTPYKYKANPDEASKSLKNPLRGNMSPDILSRGKERYNIYCMICHGQNGLGDGTIADKMPVKPPSLVTDKFKAYTDGRIYHVIVDGWGLMGSYSRQILSEKDRWAVVNYVRNLQKGQKN